MRPLAPIVLLPPRDRDVTYHGVLRARRERFAPRVRVPASTVESDSALVHANPFRLLGRVDTACQSADLREYRRVESRDDYASRSSDIGNVAVIPSRNAK